MMIITLVILKNNDSYTIKPIMTDTRLGKK